jgi:hypothetical protein
MFHFGSGTTIAAQGNVSLMDGESEVGRWAEVTGWSILAFQQLLNITVTGYSIPNDRVLQIKLDNGLTLQVHDSSDQYESFQITRKGIDEMIVV